MGISTIKNIVGQKRGAFQVKTFVSDVSSLSSGSADEELNAFFCEHNVVNVSFSSHSDKCVCRILYRD